LYLAKLVACCHATPPTIEIGARYNYIPDISTPLQIFSEQMQKEKSQKICFYTVKLAVKSSLVILFALVIHTALTVVTSLQD
jgi:hypothetical protein